MNARQVLRTFIPKSIRRYLSSYLLKYKSAVWAKRYQKNITQLKDREKIRVAFFLIHDSVWKLDHLFKLMLADNRYEPIVVICPNIVHGDDVMFRDMNRCEEFVKKRGYPYLLTYDKTNDSWLDVRTTLCPDVIFFTNPYRGLTKDEYYVLNYPNSLNCYVTYSSVVFGNLEWELNQPFHNYIWKYFVENEIIQELSIQTLTSQRLNSVVTGFPCFDECKEPNYVPQNMWKHNQKIKIIWAPHHTIDDNPILMFSNFIQFADIMIATALKYVDTIQIAFKPHPILHSKLVKIWGQEKTDNYYMKWSDGINTQLSTGDYIDLFLTSDAMIFDSVSFISEYLYMNKPSAFINSHRVIGELNTFGRIAMNCHQEVSSTVEIEQFIEQVIQRQADPKAGEKEQFYADFVAKYQTPTASNNIINYLNKVL